MPSSREIPASRCWLTKGSRRAGCMRVSNARASRSASDVVPSSHSTVLSALRSEAGHGCPIRPNTTVLVYNDTSGGAGNWSTQWETAFWSWLSERDPQIRPQFLLAADIKRCESLLAYPSLQAWVQPGGDARKVAAKLGLAGKAKIVAFVESGGLYIGTCAGFYYAAWGFWWQARSSYLDAGFWSYPASLGIFPSYVEGSITDLQKHRGGNTTCNITVKPGGALPGRNVSRHAVLYFGGPTLGWRDTLGVERLSERLGVGWRDTPGAESLGEFDDVPGKPPAIVSLRYARGTARTVRALLFSVHLEAHERIGRHNVSHADRLRNYELRAALIRRELPKAARMRTRSVEYVNRHRMWDLVPPAESRTWWGE